MSLKDRLSRLTGEAGSPFHANLKHDRFSELRCKINEIMNRSERLGAHHISRVKDRPVSLESVVTGEEAETPQGRFFVSRRRLNAGDFHGHMRVGDLVCPCMEAVAFLADSDVLKGLSMESMETACSLTPRPRVLQAAPGPFLSLSNLGGLKMAASSPVSYLQGISPKNLPCSHAYANWHPVEDSW